MGLIMYELTEIIDHRARSFGLYASHALALEAINAHAGKILIAECDYSTPECLDVMTQSLRQFTIEPIKGLRENNETARWYDTSAG